VRTGIFIQVRLGSTRLPGKALLELPGGPVIRHVMRSLATVHADVRALLTDGASAEALEPIAGPEGYVVFKGPEEDLLARYCQACRAFDVGRVIRVTGDNPLTSAALAARILALHEEGNADLSHYLGNPWGTGVEVVEAAALFKAEQEAVQPDEREHLTTWLYRHRERFAILEPQAPADSILPEARVTIDSPEDFQRVTGLFADLYRGAPIECAEVVRWFHRRAARGGSNA
jgi:spore coat polysaccharide biosynthesis protein SpsF